MPTINQLQHREPIKREERSDLSCPIALDKSELEELEGEHRHCSGSSFFDQQVSFSADVYDRSFLLQFASGFGRIPIHCANDE